MTNCHICGADAKSVRSLSRHIRDVHKTNSETYWNMSNIRPICPRGSQTRFKNISVGYEDFCGHSCAAKDYRRKMKSDAAKFDSFRGKVSENMKRVWESRDEKEARGIFARAGETNRAKIATLTDEQRREKYNHNPGGHYKSLKEFWETAPREEKERVWELIRQRADATMISRTPEEYIKWLNKNVEDWINAGGFDHVSNALGA